MTTKTQREKVKIFSRCVIDACVCALQTATKFDYRLAAFELIRHPIYYRNAHPSCSWSRPRHDVERSNSIWITPDVLLDKLRKKRNWKKNWSWCGIDLFLYSDGAKYRFSRDCSILSTLYIYILWIYIYYIAFHWIPTFLRCTYL